MLAVQWLLFLASGWNHLEPAARLARLKHRILGHVTQWRLRPVSTNEGGRGKKKKKKRNRRSVSRPALSFFFLFLWSLRLRVPNRSILSLKAEPIRTSVTRSLLHLSQEALRCGGWIIEGSFKAATTVQRAAAALALWQCRSFSLDGRRK